ncbi:hypothetical protein ATI61_114215 [Archangium gephyra]|uniref:Uncharacterized protein n=1 Tax=Archangium gephyra TaxID=48 RepID=A0AAC8Q500_9BACT|nr:hypothetical protein [Archangium gephyra]AKJ01076.1 Hypothetical protein AA314_02702 [Archangium gephyra]REG24606.1 hypothetical protein ATI61_114215 [Archangium gephyra]
MSQDRDEDAFHQRWMAGADAIARLYVTLLDAPFEQYEREFLALQRKLLATVKTPWEHLETRRRIAEEILLGAFGCNAPWPDFGRALRRIRRLGYTDVERQVHVAILFARWAKFHPEQLLAARRMLDLAERQFQSVSPEHTQYKDMKGSLELIRKEKEFRPDSSIP